MGYIETLKKIKALPVIDTHEHIGAERDMVNQPLDVFNLFIPYICDNLLTAGMKSTEWAVLQNKSIPFEERWNVFSPYLSFIKFSTYFQALFITLRDIYGMKEFTLAEAKKVNLRITEDNVTGLYDKVKTLNNIESILTFISYNYQDVENVQKSGLYAVPTVSDICIRNKQDIKQLEDVTSITISNFDNLLQSIDILFEKYKNIDVKAIKFGSAYRRKLDFELQTRHDAEKVFIKVISQHINGDTKMFGMQSQTLGDKDGKILDDYLTDYMVALADKYDFKVFFHAGIHAWNENNIEAVRVSCLEDLIRRHEHVQFILLHCGMPFIDEAVLLCKYFTNVHLNLTWSHIIDRRQSVELIVKMVEMLPLNKIHGFGGDYCNVIQIYGHLQIALENITEGLYYFVDKGTMNEDEAVNIAKMWLYENPKKLLNI